MKTANFSNTAKHIQGSGKFDHFMGQLQYIPFGNSTLAMEKSPFFIGKFISFIMIVFYSYVKSSEGSQLLLPRHNVRGPSAAKVPP